MQFISKDSLLARRKQLLQLAHDRQEEIMTGYFFMVDPAGAIHFLGKLFVIEMKAQVSCDSVNQKSMNQFGIGD